MRSISNAVERTVAQCRHPKLQKPSIPTHPQSQLRPSHRSNPTQMKPAALLRPAWRVALPRSLLAPLRVAPAHRTATKRTLRDRRERQRHRSNSRRAPQTPQEPQTSASQSCEQLSSLSYTNLSHRFNAACSRSFSIRIAVVNTHTIFVFAVVFFFGQPPTSSCSQVRRARSARTLDKARACNTSSTVSTAAVHVSKVHYSRSHRRVAACVMRPRAFAASARDSAHRQDRCATTMFAAKSW
mmetsp:Transcript_9380/g.24861  ORF Transcript_9380/g.24861 Transcript_9380/m.24861 type:complete len:241 (-) Transcript_9380:4895-5617(-)